MINWQITPIKLALKYTWKISRNTSTFKTNFLITCDQGNWKGLGETAPNIRYNETPEVMLEEFNKFVAAGANHVHDLNDLEQLLNSLHLKNALRFGIESAYIHMLCHAERTPIHTFLGIPPAHDITTSYTLPIMAPGEIVPFFEQNQLSRFEILKIKTNAENGADVLKALSTVSKQPLIIDANEAFTDADSLLRFLYTLKPYPVILIEQPMPATCTDAYREVKQHHLYPLMADESICDDADFADLATQFDVVNMKLMKAGGYLNGIRILEEAKQHHMKTMVGCMVETSLGISGAFHMAALTNYADLDGYLIVQDEPFGLLDEQNGKINLNR